jgi:hypothetical protein
VTGNSGSDFRIKLLVVHPDGRRQKFLVTFPERRTLKIDQRYIGLPLTLRVDFVPGSIVCRPGTGHTLTIAGKPVKEHSLNVNDVVGLDQYSIEFLELPEPLPMEEATRFVSIDEMVEATVVVSSPPKDDSEFTPLPQIPNAQLPYSPQAPPVRTKTPTPALRVPEAPRATVAPVVVQQAAQQQPVPQQAAYSDEPRRPDPEDSTAIIRRLHVPGTMPASQNSYSNYSTLEPANRSDATSTGTFSRNTHTGYSTEAGVENPDGTTPRIAFNKKHLMMAGAALAVLAGYLVINPSNFKGSGDSTELSSEAGPDSASAPADPSGEMKPMDIPDTHTETSTKSDIPVSADPDPAVVPNQALIPAPVPMASGGSSPMESPFDDKSGFDPIAVDQFFDAVDAGDEARIKELVEKRVVDINLSRRRGYAALHLASARGDLATVKYLIRMKADTNVLDGSGATPLMWAVFRRHESVVKFLAPKTDLKIARQGGETAHDLAKRMKMTRLLKTLDPEPKKTAKKRDTKKRVPSALPDKKK